MASVAERPALVTGGTGFVGRELCRHLLEQGRPLYVLARTPERVAALLPGAMAVKGDLAGDFAWPEGIGTIFHCAGVISREAEMEPVNVAGTARVVDWALRHGCRLVHLSSAGVVGATSARVVDESTACRPGNPYERSKWRAEELVRTGVARGLDARMLRPTIVFGPGREPERDSLLQLVRAILAGRYRHIRGGTGIYNLAPIAEVARTLAELDRPGLESGFTAFFNQPIRFADFADIVREAAGEGVRPPRHLPYGAAWLAAAGCEALRLFTGRAMPFGFSRLRALTGRTVYAQARLEREAGFRVEHDLAWHLRATLSAYRAAGLLSVPKGNKTL